MSYAQWCNSYNFSCSLRYHVNFCIGVYSGLSGRVKTVYLFSTYAATLLTNRFNTSALVWFFNFLKCLVFNLFISLRTVFNLRHHESCCCLCTKMRFEWIGESWIENTAGFRCWTWRLPPVAEFIMFVWV
jgi:hypothetical protein